MLVACESEVPDPYREQCERLLAACPSHDARRIRERVEQWMDMLAPHPRMVDWVPRRVAPADPFSQLRAVLGVNA
jgi:hypothetical protein